MLRDRTKYAHVERRADNHLEWQARVVLVVAWLWLSAIAVVSLSVIVVVVWLVLGLLRRSDW